MTEGGVATGMEGVATGGGGVKELLEKVSVSTRPVRAAVTGAAGFFPAAGSVFDVLDLKKKFHKKCLISS